MKKRSILLNLFLSSILFSCSNPSQQTQEVTEEKQAVQTRNDLPNMLITTLDNAQVNLQSIKGNTILILFQPDCDHCQREAEEIREYIDSFKDYNLYFISADQMPAIEKFAKDYGLLGHANIYFGTTTVDNVLNNFGSIPAPSVYIYANQQLQQKFNGEVAIEKILQAI
jgi:peroxiredoxin